MGESDSSSNALATVFRNNLTYIFGLFDCISLEDESNKEYLVSQVVNLLSVADLVIFRYKGSWAELFYNRMIVSQNLLEKKRMLFYKKIMVKFLQYYTKKDEFFYSGTTLLEFLKTHEMDPDNCIIGLTPSLEISTQAKDSKETVRMTSSYLKHKILELSELKGEESSIELKKLSQNVKSRNNSSLTKGEIVVCRMNDKFIYGRYTGNRTDTKINVYISGDERQVEAIDMDGILFFNAEMLECFQDLKTMKKLVRDSMDQLQEQISEEIRKRTEIFLTKMGVDVDFLALIHNKKSLLDLNVARLEMTSNKLKSLTIEPSYQIQFNSFLCEVEEFGSKQLLEFFNSLNGKDFFLPMAQKALKRMKDLSLVAEARNMIKSYQVHCDEAARKIKEEKVKLLNGNAKREITEWWLNHIKGQMTLFLESLHYDFNAVPTDYTSKPPKNITSVRKNLELIEDILDTSTNNYQEREFMENLSKEIYEKIDEFQLKMQLVLKQELDITLDEGEIPMKEQLSILLQSKEQGSDQIGNDVAEGLLKDIKYLQEMKRLEKHTSERGLEIVPITGLIVGRFCRLKQELLTVLELWEKEDQKNEVTVEAGPWSQMSLTAMFGEILQGIDSLSPKR